MYASGHRTAAFKLPFPSWLHMCMHACKQAGICRHMRMYVLCTCELLLSMMVHACMHAWYARAPAFLMSLSILLFPILKNFLGNYSLILIFFASLSTKEKKSGKIEERRTGYSNSSSSSSNSSKTWMTKGKREREKGEKVCSRERDELVYS